MITRIWRIAKLLDDDRRRTMARLGMDAAARHLLATLRRAGPPYALPPGEIARRCALSPGSISQQVAKAEEQGLVRRRRHEGDGRGVVVELTPEGHELIERTVDELLSHEETLLAGLSCAQRGQLSDLLRVLLNDLNTRAAQGDR